MAKESGSALGSILGVVIGAILIAGIAGTPFYISMLQNENRGLDIAVSDDVEGLRRVVQHLDQHLAAMADANALAPDDAMTPADVAGLTLPEKKTEGPSSLELTRKMLNDADMFDKRQGTEITKVRLPSQGSPADAVTQVTKRFETENKELEAKAQKAINALRQIKVGTAGANSNLSATQAQAIYWTAAAKMHANRADLEEDLASLLMRKSSWNVDAIATLQLDIEAAEAQIPTATIAALRGEASKIEEEIARIESNADSLRGDASELREELSSTEEAATQVDGKMAELESLGIEDSIDRSKEYEQLTQKSIELTSRIATLKNGAAADGEEEVTGLRDVEYRIKQAEESIAGWQKALAHFEEQIDKLTASERELTNLRNELMAQKRELASSVESQLAAAAEHQANAQKSREEALEALGKARTLATTAINLAGRRANNVPESEPQLKDMIRKDGDTRASVLCLAAEIDFTEALLLTKRIQTLRDAYETNSNIARMIDTDTPEDPASAIEELQVTATEKLAEATKRYEEAANSLKASSIKTQGGTISGSNYAWQTNIGLASIELLRSTLTAAATGSVDTEAQDKAYTLLTEAVKDREKSPLLTPAIDVIRYLQHRVAE